MKAVVLTPFPPDRLVGGEELHTRELARVLERAGLEVSVRHPASPAEATDLLVLNGGSGSVALRAGHWVKRARHIWVVPHNSWPTASRMNHPVWLRPVGRGVSAALRRAFLRLERRGAVFIAVSEANREELARDFGVRAVVIPNAVHLPEPPGPLPRAVRTARERYPLVGAFVGRWDAQKNPAVLRAMVRAMPEGVGLVFVSAPSGVHQRAFWPPLRHPRLAWVGPLRREEVHAVYRSVDFVLFPSRYESFGYVVAEAAACGTLPFATPTGVAAEMARDPFLAECVIRVPPYGNEPVQAVWARIQRLMTPAARTVKQARLRHFAARFRPERWEGMIRDLLERTLAVERGGA
ncbi:glycosyltransferase family 4 protein [Marinithermus hydrothermalis]|uniref:Glycosyl transferase group 1 n=1 Tax=Marinithermus hydrothermalis (strain DSM 14884 / JCM 11576 / T1) TaxID=869210 RepID=F2NQP4_MARHT|nr:glycosyltransferase family 4 protein [Marinithermus hydrothermalis]AEB11982.1 glycosyl transferase group 1 [Marinithermus hydrothermalis DSM 14884]